MNKQYFIELAEYNLWANNIACGWLENISDEQWNKPIISSFNSIQQTVLHIISAENTWLQRFKNEPVVWLQSTYKGTKKDHIALWKKHLNLSNYMLKILMKWNLLKTLIIKG